MSIQYPDLFDENGLPEENQKRAYLYYAVCYLLRHQFPLAPVGDDIVSLPNAGAPQRQGAPVKLMVNILPEAFASSNLEEEKRRLILGVYGRMLAANMDDPALGRPIEGPKGADDILLDISPTTRVRIAGRFSDAFTGAVKFYMVNADMFMKVYRYLVEVGKAPSEVGTSGPDSFVFAAQLARVVQRLVDQRVSPDAPQIRLHIEGCVKQTVGTSCNTGLGGGGRYSNIDLDLPDLSGEISAEIYPDNVRAVSVIYFAAQLEDMRLFSAADEVAHQFAMGALPISRGAAGDNLFEYIKGAQDRFTELERRGFYSRALGMASGGDGATPNREFQDLWIRALSAISSFNRQTTAGLVEGYDRLRNPAQLISLNIADNRRVHHMHVFKSLRDLTINLSLHGFAMAHYAAVELQQTILQVRTMLSHPDVLSAYGVRDYFQLVERVARMYMNSDVNTMRQRVLAQSGSRIIQWLAEHSETLASPGLPEVGLFSDPDLASNVERWLAVTGTSGSTIERYSEPTPTPAQSTIPSLQAMRSAVREAESALGNLQQSINPKPPTAEA